MMSVSKRAVTVWTDIALTGILVLQAEIKLESEVINRSF